MKHTVLNYNELKRRQIRDIAEYLFASIRLAQETELYPCIPIKNQILDTALHESLVPERMFDIGDLLALKINGESFSPIGLPDWFNSGLNIRRQDGLIQCKELQEIIEMACELNFVSLVDNLEFLVLKISQRQAIDLLKQLGQSHDKAILFGKRLLTKIKQIKTKNGPEPITGPIENIRVLMTPLDPNT